MQVENGTKKLSWRLSDLSVATGMSVSFWRKEIRENRLQAKKVGSSILILDEELKKYLANCNKSK